jgi:hypothetical protein
VATAALLLRFAWEVMQSPYAPPAGQATLVFVQNQPKDYIMRSAARVATK